MHRRIVNSALDLKWDDPILENHVQAHTSSVCSLAYNQDGSQLASGSKDGIVKVWNPKNRMTSYVFKDDEAPIHSVKFTPCGKMLASASRQFVKLRTPKHKSQYFEFKAHILTVRGLDFCPSGNLMATCSDDKSVKVWRIGDLNHQFLFSLTGHSNWVRCVKFPPKSDHQLATCSDDSTIKLWDLNGKMCTQTFKSHHPSIVKCVEFHPEGHFLASSGNDKQINIFDLRTNRLIQNHSIAIGSANDLKFDAYGKHLFCALSDGTVKVFDMLDAKLVYTLHGHQGQVHCLDFDKDSGSLCSGDSVGKILFWKTNFNTKHQVDAIPKMAYNIDIRKSRNSEETSKTSPKTSSGFQSRPISVGPAKLSTNQHHCSIIRQCASAKPDGAKTATLKKSIKSIDKTVPTELYNGDHSLALKIDRSLRDMMSQMSLLVSTLSLMEERLTRTENKVGQMARKMNFH